MTKFNMFFAAIAMIFFVYAQDASAQMVSPVASPAASISQNVGFTKISIDYSSPAVKGRKIFGEIEKYDVTWRAGANAATTIEFSTMVNIGGKNIRPGKYTLFMTPRANGEWTVRLNSKGNSVFAYMKDGKIDEEALAKDDVVTVNVKAEPTTSTYERLQYAISAEDNKVAKITMKWENVKVSFMVDTQVDQKMEGFKNAF
ncbi:MAG: DUF2911 domain-containing protein [Mongoliitalea sp.]